MNDNTQKPPAETPPQQEADSVLSRIAATIGVVSLVLYFAPIFARLLLGSDRIGLTAYGERLHQQLGLSYSVAAALEPTPVMGIAILLAVIGFIIGMIAVFGKGRKRRAKIGVYTSVVVLLMAFGLPAL
jgi:hypothetical protein